MTVCGYVTIRFVATGRFEFQGWALRGRATRSWVRRAVACVILAAFWLMAGYLLLAFVTAAPSTSPTPSSSGPASGYSAFRAAGFAAAVVLVTVLSWSIVRFVRGKPFRPGSGMAGRTTELRRMRRKMKLLAVAWGAAVVWMSWEAEVLLRSSFSS